jgi:alcohol dehydrogenase class IV
MAFSNALLGITHSMAHKTGAAFSGGHIVHGAANAIYLPKVIQYNAKESAAAERYVEIARFIAIPARNPEEGTQSLVNHIKAMNMALGIPSGIRDYENGIIGEREFLEKLPEVAVNAVGDACTGSNPRKITPPEMEQLLKACYYNKDVDF